MNKLEVQDIKLNKAPKDIVLLFVLSLNVY